MKLAVVSFKYPPHRGYRSSFTAKHVNVHFNMFARHLRLPHDYVCVTDDPAGLDPRIRAVPIWGDHADLPNPHGDGVPRCYRRLRLFARDAAELIGARRFIQADLDIVLAGDVTPTFDRPEPIVLLPTLSPNVPFNGSLLLMDAGCRPQVWENFDPATSPARNKAAGCAGSDQGQISYELRNRGEATWKIGANGDGIYFWGKHLAPLGGRLPADARLVSFHGRLGDPWLPAINNIPWVNAHWR